MNNFEDPIMPPEGDAYGGRYESADIDIEELRRYLVDTKFESEEDIANVLTGTYSMSRKDDVGDIEANMTREYKVSDIKENAKRLLRGEELKKAESQPLSGHEPQAVLRVTLRTLGDKSFDLRIFKVFNRNQNYRFEYVLGLLSEDKE